MNTRFLQKISTKIAGIFIIVIVFFLLIVFGVLLPIMEQELMKSRKDSLQSLVDVAFNLVDDYNARVKSGELSLDEAKERFTLRIKNMRFQNYDYYWVQDDSLPYPTMIMHPADPSLNGEVIDDPRFNHAFAMQFGDSGQELFFPDRDKSILQAAAEVSRKSGSGFISYNWPKPTARGLTVAYYPKQSFVKLFQPWGWIIGTGLYYDDIEAQMARLRWTIIIVVAGLLSLTALMTLVVLRNITLPLNALLKYSGEISRGNLDAQVSGKISGEFLQLKQSTEAMVKTLRNSIQKAREKTEDAYREAERSRKTEEALKHSKERLQLVMDTTRDGIWDWNIITGETYFNRAYYALLGYLPEDFRMNSESWAELIHPDDRSRVLFVNQECIDGDREDFKIVYRMRTKDGQWRWILGRGKAVTRDENGRALRMIGSHVDITEAKQAEVEREKLLTQLHQAQKMESVGRLAGGIAHDFNNMLSIINGYAELSLNRLNPADPLYENIRQIFNAGKRSADIVRQLLAFARKQTISPVRLDLNNTISSLIKILQRLIGENIELIWRPGSNLWPIEIDPSQVDQIMANLVVNARDAISDVGTLTIDTKNVVFDEEYCRTHTDIIPGQYVMLAVSDNGCGMDSEILDKLFEPFFTTKSVGKGTGLGLPTIYGIVKQNKGFIKVYSIPGEGTTFTIYFPRDTSPEDTSMAALALPKQMPTGSETILIVEDEPAILQMGKEITESLGYTVLTAEKPTHALQLAEEYDGTIHLLITDIVMPEMNGRDLASQLSISNPGLKILYMSGYTSDVIAHHGILDKGLNFIQKPFSLKNLAIKLREVIDQE